MFVDAHLHMTDSGFGDDITDAKLLFSNTAKPSEYEKLMKLAKEDERIVPFFGTHPWYADEYDEETLEEIIKNNPKTNVGEIGLDSKKGDIGIQLPVFLSQIDIASKFERIASIHMVGCENYILDALKKHKTKVILHSFSGPVSYVKPFTQCGCYFSISPRIFNKSSEKVKSIIQSIPIERLLLETDAPNNDIQMSELAEKVGKIIDISSEKLLEIVLNNASVLAGYKTTL